MVFMATVFLCTLTVCIYIDTVQGVLYFVSISRRGTAKEYLANFGINSENEEVFDVLHAEGDFDNWKCDLKNIYTTEVEYSGNAEWHKLEVHPADKKVHRFVYTSVLHELMTKSTEELLQQFKSEIQDVWVTVQSKDEGKANEIHIWHQTLASGSNGIDYTQSWMQKWSQTECHAHGEEERARLFNLLADDTHYNAFILRCENPSVEKNLNIAIQEWTKIWIDKNVANKDATEMNFSVGNEQVRIRFKKVTGIGEIFQTDGIIKIRIGSKFGKAHEKPQPLIMRTIAQGEMLVQFPPNGRVGKNAEPNEELWKNLSLESVPLREIMDNYIVYYKQIEV